MTDSPGWIPAVPDRPLITDDLGSGRRAVVRPRPSPKASATIIWKTCSIRATASPPIGDQLLGSLRDGETRQPRARAICNGAGRAAWSSSRPSRTRSARAVHRGDGPAGDRRARDRCLPLLSSSTSARHRRRDAGNRLVICRRRHAGNPGPACGWHGERRAAIRTGRVAAIAAAELQSADPARWRRWGDLGLPVRRDGETFRSWLDGAIQALSLLLTARRGPFGGPGSAGDGQRCGVSRRRGRRARRSKTAVHLPVSACLV